MNKQLSRIVAMAKVLTCTRQRVQQLEAQLEKAKDEQRQLETVDLPELMREAELQSFKLKNGDVIELEDDFACGITEANHARAMAWLEKHGFGGLIKTQIKVDFNRDDYKKVLKLDKQFLLSLKKSNMEAHHELKETVHASTLKSFIREQLKKGKTVPAKIFSFHPLTKVKITSKED